MWIFGYGSLMWDGWERGHGCTRRSVARLVGFRRAFNKASVKNWGTKQNPGPTLNLVRDRTATCCGIAFEFPEGLRPDVVAYLARREGKAFPLREQRVTTDDGKAVVALVPLYEGNNLVHCATADEMADMVSRAVGSEGHCIDYVKGIGAKLNELKLDDPAVTELLGALKKRGHA